jgi:hypothetical protein
LCINFGNPGSGLVKVRKRWFTEEMTEELSIYYIMAGGTVEL